MTECNTIRLNLGCGDRRMDGYVGVDMVKTDATDVVHDLRVAPWPFDADTVEEVYCAHFLEHLTGTERMAFMDELYRVMQRGAKAMIITPYWSSIRSIQDPTHQWPPVCEATFLYFNKDWRVNNKLDHYPIVADFDYTYGYTLDGPWVTRHHEAQAFAIAHYSNVARDLQVTLVKR